MTTDIRQFFKNIFSVTYVWACVFPIQILGLLSIIYLLFFNTFDLWWLYTLFGYILIKEFGVAIGYHRVFAHNTFKPRRWAKLVFLLGGILSGQGSPMTWAGIHRGKHHRYTDADGDPHSPKHGLFHSYFLWICKHGSDIISVKDIPRQLLRDSDVLFVHKNYVALFYLLNLLCLLISFELWLFGIILPSFLTFQVFNIQTSISHIKLFGYRNYNTKDNSYNNILLFPLVQGEAWHNNHHNDAKNFNFGKRWWEIDPTYWIIKLFMLENKSTNLNS